MESGGGSVTAASAAAAGGRNGASANAGLGSRMETAAVTVSPIPSSAASVSVPIELVQAAAGIRPTITTTQAGGAAVHPSHLSASPPPQQPGQQADLSTTAVYVDANGDLVAQSGIQLTTITVAVPAPLSPSDPALLQAAANAAAAGTSHLPPAVLPHLSPTQPPPPPPPPLQSSAPPALVGTPTTVALPTVPAPQETALKWKYEQSKDKASSSSTGGSSLVRKQAGTTGVDPSTSKSKG